MNIQEMSDKQYKKFKRMFNNRYKHTKTRTKERFGLSLTISEYYEMIADIICGESVLLYKNKWVEFHCICYKNSNIISVYEPKTYSIRTVLKLEQFK